MSNNPDLSAIFPDSGKNYLDLPRGAVKIDNEGKADVLGSYGHGVASEASKIWSDNSIPQSERVQKMGQLLGQRMEQIRAAGFDTDQVNKIKKSIGEELKKRIPELPITITEEKESESKTLQAALGKQIQELMDHGLGAGLVQVDSQGKAITPSPELSTLVQQFQPQLEQSLRDIQQEEADLAELEDLKAGRKQDQARLNALGTKYSFGQRFRDRDLSQITRVQQAKINAGFTGTPDQIREQVTEFNRRMVDALAYKIYKQGRT